MVILLCLLIITTSVIYLLYCLNPRENTILYKLKYILEVLILNNLKIVLIKIFGDKMTNYISKIYKYLTTENHPLVQYFYYFIFYVGQSLFYYSVYNYYLEFNYAVITLDLLIVLLAYICYNKCCNTNSYLTIDNYDYYYNKYIEYIDDVIYKNNNFCDTCCLNKPPLTKHCSICNKCIVNHDHHCIWIKGCVGEKNYKWFILFLLSHSLLSLYKFFMLGYVIYFFIIIKKRLYESEYTDINTGEIFKANNNVIFRYLFYKYNYIMLLVVLTICLGIALLLFVLYHLYLINKGLSTSQNIKYASILDYYNDELDLKKKQNSNQVNEIYTIVEKLKKSKLNPKNNNNSLYYKLKNVFKR